MPKNLGRYDNDLSVPRKKDIDDLTTRVEVVEEAVASKQDTITGGASTITDDNLTANRALVSNGSGKVAVSEVTSTELGYLDGVTSNVQTQLNKIPAPWTSTPKVEGNGSPGTSTQYARGDHVHPKRTLYEAELKWGGGSIQGNTSPIDSAMMPIIGYNKTDCAKPAGITVEYSNDAGATWIDYGLSDRGKSNLVSMCGDSSVYIGGGTSIVQKTLDDQLRITVNATKCGTYTALKKILIEISTNGATGVKVLIEKAKGTAPTEFSEVGTYNIIGWSAWNSIDIGQVYFGGGTEQNMWVLRFTFSIGGLNTGGYTSALQVMHILFLGGTNWGTPSAMARTGHLYTYDVQQNATFPANVKAATFTGSANELTSTFDTWSVRDNISSGNSLTIIFSKIRRMFADLKALAFKDKVDKTDLSDAVQASLNKADTALQTAPVTSVNNKTGAVVLSASDVGALPNTTAIPTKTSELDNDSGFIDSSALDGYAKTTDIPTKTSQLTNNSGFITANDVPVKSVDGSTGEVVTNAVKTTSQSLTDAQKAQARTNIGAGTSSFDGDYESLSNKPTIPTQTSQLENNSGFITSADVPTKVSQLDNDTGFITSNDVPEYSVVKATDTSDYAAVYYLTKNGVNTGVAINIPKDLFVESGEIVTNPSGQPAGKYLKLVLQNQDEPIYINVADLVDAYTSGLGITISTNNEISIKIVAGNGLSADTDGIKMATVTTTINGAMLSSDKVKLDGIENGAQKNTVTGVKGDNETTYRVGNVNITKANIGLSNVDNVKQYSTTNPPPYPVTSVNNKTGAVVLDASDVGALPDTTVIPVVNDATLDIQRNGVSVGTFTSNASADKTINITVPTKASDVGALPDTTSIPSKTSELDNDSGFITSAQAPVQSVNGQTGAVTVDVDIPDNLVKYTAVSDVQSVDGLNADTLEGHNAAYFATASGLSATNAQVATNTNNISTLNSGLSTANNNISTLQTAMTDKLDKSGGTMTGTLVAQNNTNYTTAQVRNVIISTADPSGGSNGMLWIKYTP